MTVSYGGLYQIIALKATAAINLILNHAKDTERQRKEGLNPGAVCEVCVKCRKKGSVCRGSWLCAVKQVTLGLLIKHAATWLCVRIKWKQLHYDRFQHIHSLCV